MVEPYHPLFYILVIQGTSGRFLQDDDPRSGQSLGSLSLTPAILATAIQVFIAFQHNDNDDTGMP